MAKNPAGTKAATDQRRPFSKLVRHFTPARRVRVAMKAARLEERLLPAAAPAMPIEKGDVRVGVLRRYIEALGGTLEITAHFDKATVVICNVGET
jgi:hypothetical protein